MRPYPPVVLDEPTAAFLPSAELEVWVRSQIIDEGAPIENEDHQHLRQAELGFLWTNVDNSRAGRTVLGQCEIMPPMAMGKWQRERAIFQVEKWFGSLPDFLITIHAGHAAQMDDPTFLALVEHELYHAAQATDEFGQPKFNKDTGRPVYAIRGHDVEEFVGVVRRYGAAAAGVEDMVRAANRGPEVAQSAISLGCGTCLRLVKG